MHGVQSNNHVAVTKPDLIQPSSEQGNMTKREQARHQLTERKTKHHYGHTMADVEQQISDWLVETNDSKK
jgi:hypothetical protein